MEIKRIKEESYESISRYLDILTDIIPKFYDLCFVDYNNKRYMVALGDGKVAIVENDNGVLNPYSLSAEEVLKLEYITEEADYEIIDTDSIKEVCSTAKLTGDRERISYMKAEDKFDKDILEYVQFINSKDQTLTLKYDVSNRGTAAGSVLFTKFHNPDVVELEKLRNVLFIYYNQRTLYSLGLKDDNNYYSPLFHIGKVYMGSKKETLSSSKLFENLTEMGFIFMDDSIATHILAGDDRTFNDIKTISDEYKNYIKRH